MKLPLMNSGLYMHLLGLYGLLGECAVYVPEDLRESIERAFADANKNGIGIQSRRILNSIVVGPKRIDGGDH